MFYSKIEKLCKIRGMSITGLCRKIGISPSTATDWRVKGSQPQAATVKKIAEFFGLSISYFYDDEKNNAVPVALDNAVAKINVYGTIPAGVPMTAIENIIGTEEIPAAWLGGGREYFALKIRGDSMYPRFLEGDIVIFRKDSICETGDDCVVYINGEDATLKRVKWNDDGSLTLQPLNANYAPRTFSPKQIRELPITIGGIAVELRRKI